ncbi:flavin reductase family protein [Novosphingobium mathurense]|uniref:NADH-FMN oxidoreductase RutF, flavin reductase (DIM6/NTAB) family n=1 Tax=Novosphingobium mathurense TaxID=428990 RepID=A0A1U6I227_9SPHN|nr:flavin reductase family protein [Novosphingobium mathurense]SLK02095.1 NADH-FMN oxidoreductase RutF, flavin reductase (DIM6/NTAB) family [Novosphingobium mathurense]
MEFDFSNVPGPDRYKLMSSSITPRPIAWVTTVSGMGVRNAAPYSFFNMMSAEPPLIVLGMMRRPDGSHKDSAANILETEEFVVNLVSEADSAAMNFTCIDAPPEFDELEAAGLETLASTQIAPPRIATAPVAMECRLYQSIEAGQTTIALGEVLRFHIADTFIDAEKLHVDTLEMGLIARVHGAGWYARTTDLFQMTRPTYAKWAADKISG